jgi:hypothetical protein
MASARGYPDRLGARMLLLIQRTRISWSKRSRGGELAQLRSRIPTRASVPSPRPGSAWLLHRLDHYEDHGDAPPFGPPCSSVEEGEGLPREGLHLGFDGLRLLVVGEDLEVHNAMGRSSLPAAPGRPDRWTRVGAVLLRVAPRTWAGWVANERHVGMDTGNWWYSETHWCFGWLPRHEPQAFTAREPARWLDHRARLR